MLLVDIILLEETKMKSKVIQEFKAEINGIEFTNQDLYWEVDYIIGEIENALGIELPTEFIKDFTNAYTKLYNSVDAEYLYDFKSEMISSWDMDIKDIKELRFSVNGFCYDAELFIAMNEKIADWDNTYGKK
jgi:hypothetical protein